MIKWPKDLKRARKLQEILQKKVKITPLKKKPEYIAGVDASFLNNKVIGVACLYRYPDIIFLEESSAVARVLFPYIPGFLSFREGPVIMEAVKRLKIKPDLILFDGQGIAHPKGLGIASHIGVLLDLPTIGCAKSRLIGEYKELEMKKGNRSSLRYHGKIVGAVLRTRDDVRPLFISPGNKIDLRGSIDVALGCTRQFRLPEPLRMADFISKKIKRELSAC
jgi:deoxyribonuclease V